MLGTSKSISGFDPRSIVGCSLWLDAADASTVTGTTTVTAWNDKSGNAKNTTSYAGTPSLTTNAINGVRAISLNGSSSLTGSITGSGTVVTVCIVGTQSTGCATNGGLLCFGRPGYIDWTDSGSFPITEAQLSGAMSSTRASVNTQKTTTGFNTPFIYILIFDGTYANTYTNGIIQTPPNIAHSGTFAYTEYKIGTRAGSTGNYYWTGYIGEILVYNSALTTTQRQSVEGYLAWKWGIKSSLPATHPFYSLPAFSRPFGPTDIPGCTLWLDAADSSTMNSTTTVTSWTDKSGLGNTMTGTATVSGSNMTFNGSTQAFSNTTFVFPSSNYSMFAVYSNTTAPASTAYMNVVYGSGGYPMLGVYGSSKFVSARSVVANTGALSPNVAASSTVLVSATYTPSTFSPFINGSTETTLAGTTLAATGLYVGGPTNYFNGSISEILIYSSNLSTTQRQQVEGYLAAKWGLLNNLPGKTLSPLNIPGCALWLDGADQSSTSMTLSGSSVTTWKDKSGNGRDLTASGSYPTITSNGVLFNGATPNVLSNATAFTAVNGINSFVVFNSTVASSRQRMFMYVYNGQKIGYTADTTYNSVFSGTVGGDGPVSYSANTTYLYGGNTYSSSPFISHSENGVETQYPSTYTVNASTQTQLLVGGQSTVYFTGTIKEVILYDAFITASQRQSVENYLMSKWGISNVTSHPFKSIPPSTSQPPQFQEVTPGNWTRDWQPYLQRLAAANSSGVTVTTSNITGGATYTDYGWSGGVMAPNGNIHFVPLYATNILVLNPTTGVTSNLTGGATYTTTGWSGAVLAPNGNIYCCPHNATNILVLNPTTGVTSNLTGGATYPGGSSGAWFGCVLAPNGNIYFCPYNATNILVLNPTTGVTSNLTGGATFTSYGWSGGVLAPNGNIYFCPYNATNILVLNPTTGVTSNLTGGATYIANGWIGGVLAPNGNIYFTPFGATNILVLNPTTGVTSNLTGGATFTSYGWMGGVLGPNGNIYFCPNNATNILVLNPTTGVTSNLTGGATFPSNGSWQRGVLGLDGNIYCVSCFATNILKITFSGLSQLPSSNYCLSAWTNKH